MDKCVVLAVCVSPCFSNVSCLLIPPSALLIVHLLCVCLCGRVNTRAFVCGFMQSCRPSAARVSCSHSMFLCYRAPPWWQIIQKPKYPLFCFEWFWVEEVLEINATYVENKKTSHSRLDVVATFWVLFLNCDSKMEVSSSAGVFGLMLKVHFAVGSDS